MIVPLRELVSTLDWPHETIWRDYGRGCTITLPGIDEARVERLTIEELKTLGRCGVGTGCEEKRVGAIALATERMEGAIGELEEVLKRVMAVYSPVMDREEQIPADDKSPRNDMPAPMAVVIGNITERLNTVVAKLQEMERRCAL